MTNPDLVLALVSLCLSALLAALRIVLAYRWPRRSRLLRTEQSQSRAPLRG